MTSKVIEQIADSPRRVRIMFRVALVTLLVAGCYNWMIKPQTSYLVAAQQRQQWDKKKSDELRRIRLSNMELKQKIRGLEAQSEQFQKVLFEPDMVRDFFCGLETLAGESGCRIESLTFDKTDDTQADKLPQDAIVQTVQASVTALGSYIAFIDFFERMSRYPQKISIHEMRFEPVSQGQPLLRCNAVIKVYVTREGARNIKNEN